jgi:hypothetical protein
MSITLGKERVEATRDVAVFSVISRISKELTSFEFWTPSRRL